MLLKLWDENNRPSASPGFEESLLTAYNEAEEASLRALEALDDVICLEMAIDAFSEDTPDRNEAKATTPSKSAQGPLSGKVVDLYRVDELLGDGGMASVYRATHRATQAQYAIKFLHPKHQTPELVKRFKNEFSAASRIKHRNVVKVHHFGIFQERGATKPLPYLVMEFLVGDRLDDVVKREGKLDPERGLRIAIQIADAFISAHSAGVVHRDGSPGNVLLLPGDVVKILDFGIAKSPFPEERVMRTRADIAMGNPIVMSPEQWEAFAQVAQVGPSADIYATGVLLYFMATGRFPFDLDSVSEVPGKHLLREPEPPSHFARISDEHERAIMTAMQKHAVDRYRSMRDMKRALEVVLASYGHTTGVSADARTERSLLRAPNEPTTGAISEPGRHTVASTTIPPCHNRNRRTVTAVIVSAMLGALLALGGMHLYSTSINVERASKDPNKTVPSNIRQIDNAKRVHEMGCNLIAFNDGLSNGDQARVGSWAPVVSLDSVPIHAALLPGGNVLYWDRHDYGNGHPFLWDGDSSAAPVKPGTTEHYDLFCAGHTFASDGSLFVAGGHIADDFGEPWATQFNPFDRLWSSLSAMRAGRWYPTTTTLPDGDIAVMSGSITPFVGVNQIFARRMHRAVWEKLVTGGTSGDAFNRAGGAVLNPELLAHLEDQWQPMACSSEARVYHSVALLLPDARVLVAGGGHPAELEDCDPTPDNPFCSALDHPNGEIFSPPYLHRGGPPQLDAPVIKEGPGVKLSANAIARVRDGATIHKLPLAKSSICRILRADLRHGFVLLGIVLCERDASDRSRPRDIVEERRSAE